MPRVLTTNALILCPHLGKGTTTPTSFKWQISGGIVSLANDAGVLACPFLPFPCIGYQLKSMGLNATQVDGRRVVLVTDFNQSFTGLPLTMQEFHQTFDESTPAPIPPGQPAPPPSPFLLDLVQPIVTTPAPSLPPYSITSHAPLTVTFSLGSAFPLRWILTLINEPIGYHQDLTQGIPGSVTVTPQGGQWSTPSLTVSITMTPAFLAALTAGKTHFFMTGVSRRGLSGFAEAVLTVGP